MKKILIALCLVASVLSGCIYVPSGLGNDLTGSRPVITVFDAKPGVISPGGRAELNWNVTGARSVSIDNGIGDVALAGSRTVSPAATTIYKITAVNPSGIATATAQVITEDSRTAVVSNPVINSFTASQTTVLPQGSTVLSWNISNAASASIDQGIGAVDPASGMLTVTPAASTTYVLTAMNASGNAVSRLSVTVVGATPAFGLPVINSLQVSSNVIPLGTTITLSWNVSNASQVTIFSGAGSILMVDPVGSIVATPFASTTYILTASNVTGSVFKTVGVTVGGGEPVSHTVILTPVAAESGSVDKNGIVSITKLAGDNSNNTAIRCYYSYDISELAGKNVTSAVLKFTVNNIVRDPFGHLGGLWVSRVNYGVGELVAADYQLAGTAFAAAFSAIPLDINVTPYVQNAALVGDLRFQTRLYFASETNNDNLADYISFTNAILTITYSQ
jgi:hypothetical protein